MLPGLLLLLLLLLKPISTNNGALSPAVCFEWQYTRSYSMTFG
jgi:hypothetical protein